MKKTRVPVQRVTPFEWTLLPFLIFQMWFWRIPFQNKFKYARKLCISQIIDYKYGQVLL